MEITCDYKEFAALIRSGCEGIPSIDSSDVDFCIL